VTRTCTVVFYGNSLFLASLGAVLTERKDMQVAHVEARRPDSILRLQAMQADVVLFDLATAQPDLMLSLFQAQPELRLVAIDLAGDRLLVLSGREFKSLAASNLLQAIKGISD
jgi:hypothetical protein